MNSRKTLKSVSVDGLKPTIMLTPIIEPYGEGYRIHHIKSYSIAPDGRDTFVPLRHVSKQKRRIFELEDENAKLQELVRDTLRWIPCSRPCSRCERYRYPEGCEFDIRRRELGIDQ